MSQTGIDKIKRSKSSAIEGFAAFFAEFLVAMATDQLIDQLFPGKMTSSISWARGVTPSNG